MGGFRLAWLAVQLMQLTAPDLEAVSVIIMDFTNAIVDRVVFKDEVVPKETLIETGVSVLLGMMIR